MTTINDQPQHLLARYADRTGCPYLLSKDSGPEWQAPRYPSAREYHQLGWTIRLVLSEYGLPSHLKPYKDNPRIPGDGYRVPTGEDSCNQRHERWSDTFNGWVKGVDTKCRFGNLPYDYRLPASVLPPDWDEMTREDAPTAATDASLHPEIFEAHSQEWYHLKHMPKGICHFLMKGGAILTINGLNLDPLDIIGWRPADAPAKLPRPEQQPQDEVQALKARVQELEGELGQLRQEYRELNSIHAKCQAPEASAQKEASASTPTLRPIAEMPADVPESFKRIFWSPNSGWWGTCFDGITHFLDIRLPAPPDPDEELRREFEAWWESLQTKPPGKNELFIAYKAGHTAR